MTSCNVDLIEAVKCVDIIPLTLLASLSRLRALVQNKNGDEIWPDLRRFINQFMKVAGIKTWKEIMIGVQELVRLLFNNNLSTSDWIIIPTSDLSIEKKCSYPCCGMAFPSLRDLGTAYSIYVIDCSTTTVRVISCTY